MRNKCVSLYSTVNNFTFSECDNMFARRNEKIFQSIENFDHTPTPPPILRENEEKNYCAHTQAPSFLTYLSEKTFCEKN